MGSIRPTMKQYQLLQFIDGFIREHGYSPSYREVMRGCDYGSVATVALHIDGLIRRGHLRKRDNSARSLEVVPESEWGDASGDSNTPYHEVWLAGYLRDWYDGVADVSEAELRPIVQAFEAVGLDEAAAVLASHARQVRASRSDLRA